jgi:hypothetical protein
METSGASNRIHLSSDTAEILMAAGKGSWIEKRKEQVNVKGKGPQTTYWVRVVQDAAAESARSGSVSNDGVVHPLVSADIDATKFAPQADLDSRKIANTKIGRLVEWNVAVLTKRLQAIQLYRNRSDAIEPKVTEQLKRHVHGIALMYRENPFHNFEVGQGDGISVFECSICRSQLYSDLNYFYFTVIQCQHASHVTMSCMKMLSRVNGDNEQAMNDDRVTNDDAKQYTKDITSDPVTQFAVVYAGLIHDLDHSGVSNDQLIKEKTRIASMYENKSVAENHSFHMAWGFLMQPEFQDLRNCICGSNDNEEVDHFSNILLNAVLATDVFDKSLKADRDARWAHVFGNNDGSDGEKDVKVLNKLKADIVLEHLIQASDVVHTMQHWHIYRKWNERLFQEMHDAYKLGRLEKNPADFWYDGELGFFDFYVIPLALKIGECGVFGVSSDEFCKYATANRHEWEVKGKEVVRELVAKYCCE